MSPVDQVSVSWGQVEELVDNLAVRIRAAGWCPTAILAIGRGGLVPATMLSHVLNVRRLSSWTLASYGANNRRATTAGEPLPRHMIGVDQLLIVDDLIDSGETAHLVLEAFPRARLAVLIQKGPVPLATYAGADWTDKVPAWIRFPWEPET